MSTVSCIPHFQELAFFKNAKWMFTFENCYLSDGRSLLLSRLTNRGPRIHLDMASSHILLIAIFTIASSIINIRGLKCYEYDLDKGNDVKKTDCKSATFCVNFDGTFMNGTANVTAGGCLEPGQQERFFDCTGIAAGTCKENYTLIREFQGTNGTAAEGMMCCCKEDLCNKNSPFTVEPTTKAATRPEKSEGTSKPHKPPTTPESPGTNGTAKNGTTPKDEAATPNSNGERVKVWTLTLGGIMMAARVF